MKTKGTAYLECYISFYKVNKYYYFTFSKGGFTLGLQELEKQGEMKLCSLEDIY